MTIDEVERLMGGPPGDYGDFPADTGAQTLEGFSCPPGSGSVRPPDGLTWFDDDEKYEFCFDSTGRLLAKHERAAYGRQGGFVARLRSIFLL